VQALYASPIRRARETADRIASVTVLRCLGLLAGCGFIERCDRGWRLRKPALPGARQQILLWLAEPEM
jgi:hypothetical protein